MQEVVHRVDASRSLVVHVDLPGVRPEDIDLTVEKDVLTIAAQRRWEASDDQRVLINERPQGSFTRQLTLGEGFDADRVEAHYHDGVLTLTVPVAEAARPRKVEVHAGTQRMIAASSADEATPVADGATPVAA
jgi:HSP20 family protein